MRLARAWFDFFSIQDPPHPADAIFVLAGRPERKTYGLRLWREGLAPTLVLSVARFEWRRFPELGLRDDGGLAALAPKVEPKKRHFFVTLTGAKTACAPVQLGRFGTLSEARIVAEVARSAGWRSVLVISNAPHLRRSALAFQRSLRGCGIECFFTAVPEEMSSVKREDWWRHPRPRKMVLLEMPKLAVYRLVLVFMKLT